MRGGSLFLATPPCIRVYIHESDQQKQGLSLTSIDTVMSEQCRELASVVSRIMSWRTPSHDAEFGSGYSHGQSLAIKFSLISVQGLLKPSPRPCAPFAAARCFWHVYFRIGSLLPSPPLFLAISTVCLMHINGVKVPVDIPKW